MSNYAEEIEDERLKLEYRLAQLETQDRARTRFIDFVRYVWPDAILGAHHEKMANAFDRIANGTLKRLIINMPPRHTKSEFASYLLPAYLMGRDPRTKAIEATHTAELAVRFGRKVRDLMDQPSYKELFPEVILKQDSKAAGRWETNKGGEYFACLRPHVLIHTRRGLVPAGQVLSGDEVLSASGWNAVREVFNSSHESTVCVAGMECSLDHPVWTMNRGWVFAGLLRPSDVLCRENILDRMKASFGRTHGYLEHADVPQVVQHPVKVRKPEEREMAAIRRSWNFCLRALAGFSKLLGRHGSAAYAYAYRGEDRQRWAVQPGKLSLGDAAGAGEQSTHERDDWRQDISAACSGDGGHAAGDSVQDRRGPRPFVPTQAQEEELRSYSDPEGLGWWRRGAARLLEGCSRAVPKLWGSTQGHLASVERAAQKLSGLLLGVRTTGEVLITDHGPQRFVNFLTEGDHTFFAEGVLTHNCGVGGAMTGRGADVLICDDPHSEQDAMSDLALDNAWEWYQSGPRTRLQPGAAVVVVMTRWGTRDMTARLIKAQSSHNADKWELIELPAILPSGKPLWPQFWKLEELLAVKASLSVQKWNAMYQQQPTNDEGAILKREWWRVWPHEEPPVVNYIIQTMDTAYSKKDTADFSVIATWGVFYPDEDAGAHIILLDVLRRRMDFPELKRVAKEQYDHWQPDNVLIEAKATGTTLQQELRRMNVPVTMYSPGGRRAGQDKISRAHSVAPILEAGIVWGPDTDWAEELVEECAAFPNGDNDDLVDVTTMALMRFRQGNFVSLRTDAADEPAGKEGLVPEYY